MSSTSKVYGITPYSWIAGPDFRAGFDEQGFWTGSQTFYCRKFDFDSTAIQTAFRKGTPVTDLYKNLSARWNFLGVQSVSHEHQPGGITQILVTYGGYSQDWDFDVDDTENGSGTFGYTATETEEPIQKNDAYRALSATVRDGIEGYLNGIYRFSTVAGEERTETQIYLRDYSNTNLISITDEAGLRWFAKIVDEKQETYLSSQIEWTRSATNLGGVPDGTLAKLGKIDPNPDGTPPVIAGRNWRLTAISDSQTKQGDTITSEFTCTWTMSPVGQEWDDDIYGTAD